MSKRLVALSSIVLCLVMLFSLVGCGNGNANTPAPGNTNTPAPGNTSTPAPGDTSTPAPAGPARDKVVNIGETQRVRGLDPHQAQDTGTTGGINYMYEALITTARAYEGDGFASADEVGLLAESWEVDPDQMYWIFNLRKDVYFHDGQLFTADDVVCTFQRLIDQRDVLNVAITEWALLDSVEKLDDYKVKINFKSANAWAGTSFINTNIIPHEAYEEMGEDLWNKQLCYGTGPWMLVEWVDGQYLQYKKNPNYWDKEHYDPYFEELYHRFIAEPSTGVAAMLSGDLDVLSSPSGISTTMLPQFAGTEDRIELIKRETVFFFLLQWACGPEDTFGDINLRKAVSLALDRQLLVDGIFGGEAYVNVGGLFGPGVDGNDPALSHTYDPDAAKALVEASSYDGKELSLITNQSMPKAEDFALAVADMANAVGFNVKVFTEEPGVYADRRFGGDYDMYIGYTSLNNAPGGVRRHFNQITTDMYHHDMGLNPDLDFEYVKGLIQTYYTAKSNEIAYQAALDYNRYTWENASPQTDVLFLKATNAQAVGMTGIKYPESGIQTFKYVDWIQ